MDALANLTRSPFSTMVVSLLVRFMMEGNVRGTRSLLGSTLSLVTLETSLASRSTLDLSGVIYGSLRSLDFGRKLMDGN